MNQESLFEYKNQVYNPGSPFPNPTSSPFKALRSTCNSPYLSTTPNPENPLKVKISYKRPRSLEFEGSLSPTSPIKKVKMTMKKEDVDASMAAMGESLLKQFIAAQETFGKDLKEDLKQDISGIKGTIDDLAEKPIQIYKMDDMNIQWNKSTLITIMYLNYNYCYFITELS